MSFSAKEDRSLKTDNIENTSISENYYCPDSIAQPDILDGINKEGMSLELK